MKNSTIITEEDIDKTARKIGIDPETMTQNDRETTRALIQAAKKFIALGDTIKQIQEVDAEIAAIERLED
jgi:DNA-binding protein YbaB